MERLIGGFFSLETAGKEVEEYSASELFCSEALWVNARSILHEICRVLQPPVCWLPSYICDTVISVIPDSVRICWYSVLPGQEEAQAAQELKKVGERDIILFVDYFGFSQQTQSLIDRFLGKANIIRDSCMMMPDLSRVDTSSEGNFFRIYSFRKTCGMPDGALVVSSRSSKLTVPTDAVPDKWFEKACSCRCLRGLHEAGKPVTDNWFAQYQEVEEQQPVGLYKISEFSRDFMKRKGTWHLQIAKRRENYQYLWHRLNEWSLFDELEQEDVPIGFPCLVNKRDQVLRKLYSENIYPAVHWDISGTVPESFKKSHEMAQQIMTLPCDHRYDVGDMKTVADAFIKATRTV